MTLKMIEKICSLLPKLGKNIVDDSRHERVFSYLERNLTYIPVSMCSILKQCIDCENNDERQTALVIKLVGVLSQFEGRCKLSDFVKYGYESLSSEEFVIKAASLRMILYLHDSLTVFNEIVLQLLQDQSRHVQELAESVAVKFFKLDLITFSDFLFLVKKRQTLLYKCAEGLPNTLLIRLFEECKLTEYEPSTRIEMSLLADTVILASQKVSINEKYIESISQKLDPAIKVHFIVELRHYFTQEWLTSFFQTVLKSQSIRAVSTLLDSTNRIRIDHLSKYKVPPECILKFYQACARQQETLEIDFSSIDEPQIMQAALQVAQKVNSDFLFEKLKESDEMKIVTLEYFANQNISIDVKQFLESEEPQIVIQAIRIHERNGNCVDSYVDHLDPLVRMSAINLCTNSEILLQRFEKEYDWSVRLEIVSRVATLNSISEIEQIIPLALSDISRSVHNFAIQLCCKLGMTSDLELIESEDEFADILCLVEEFDEHNLGNNIIDCY